MSTVLPGQTSAPAKAPGALSKLASKVRPKHVAALLTALALVGGAAGASGSGPGAPASCHAKGAYPDQACTPGVLNAAVSQGNIQQTICVKGYTATIRPPTSYTNPLKVELMKSYGFRDSLANYELDHLVSLELGGNPKDPKNLWPEAHQPSPGSPQKDKVENYLREQVCGGRMTLADAQGQISTDWVKIWEAIGRP